MLQIDLYTEITCPWCFVGLHRLDKVLQERYPDLLRARYGVTVPKSAFARPEAEARASGFDLDLGRQLYAYPTQAAHAIILAARERGTQHQLAVAITDAYFIAARNIADADVLADVAAAHGFSRDEALAIALDSSQHKRIEREAANSAAAGVRSVPHFVFENRLAINGGRSEDEIAHSIKEAVHAAMGGKLNAAWLSTSHGRPR